MAADPLIDQLAAEIRKNTVHQPKDAKKLTRQIAADFHRDLPDLADETIGAVLLRAAVFAGSVFRANPGAGARDVANLLGTAGERLYHHPKNCDAPGLEVQWRRFDYDDRKATAPPRDALVWINERFYHGVTTGYFDGTTFRVSGGSDDCEVSHWAEIAYPAAPEIDDLVEGGDDD